MERTQTQEEYAFLVSQEQLKDNQNQKEQNQQQPMSYFHTKDFKTIGLSPQKVKSVIDNLPYIEEFGVHKMNQNITKLHTKYRVSTEKLKKQFPQQTEIILNINSKVYGTYQSPDKNYISYDQYCLKQENERLKSELELKGLRIQHLEEMMKQQNLFNEQIIQLTNTNSQLNSELMKFKLSAQEAIYIRDSRIKDLEDKYKHQEDLIRNQDQVLSQQKAQIESLIDESNHKEVILRSMSKYNKLRLKKEFHNDIIALDLIDAFYGLINNNPQQPQFLSNSSNNSPLIYNSQKKQKQIKLNVCQEDNIDDSNTTPPSKDQSPLKVKKKLEYNS